jgi:hypothetical protein
LEFFGSLSKIEIKMPIKKLKIISLTFTFSFAIILILLHFLDKTVVYNTGVVSNFALAGFGWLFFISLVILSIGKVLLAKMVRAVGQKSKLSNWLYYTILFSATTNFLIGVFPTGTGSEVTIIGALHLIFAILSFVATGVFLSLFVFFNRHKNKPGIFFKGSVAVLYLICLLAFPFFPSSFIPVGERILIGLLTTGILLNMALVD